MLKADFLIEKMDCPSEEQLIRMKLADFRNIKKLEFDLQNRKLGVFFEGEINKISEAIDSLNLGSRLISTNHIDFEVADESSDKNILWKVLLINFSFFLIEMIFGLIGNSMGLVADSLDMLADTFVYSLSLYAIAGSLLIKKRVAFTSGILQFLLAFLGIIEVIRRFIDDVEMPDYSLMIIVSIFALLANFLSFVLLNRSRSKEVHIKASMIFTSNDIIANIGVIFAGILVLFLNSKIPDLVIGSIVFILVFSGAVRIIKLAK